MFSFFKKKDKEEEPPLKKKIKDLKCRKINFVDENFDELCRNMRQNVNAIAKLKPVNYYAIKNQYIMGMIYSEEDFSENYVQFLHFESERQTGKSDIFPVDAQLTVRVLAKVGIMIDLKQFETQE